MKYGSANFWSTLGRGVRDSGQQYGDLRRLDEDRARQQEMEDLNTAVLLAGMGGGSGAAPTQDTTFGPPLEAPPEWEEPALFPEPEAGPAGAEGFMEVPEIAPRREPTTIQTADPRFRELAGGKYHMEEPDSRANRLADEAFERTRGQNRTLTDDFVTGASPVIGRFGQGLEHDDPDYGDTHARAIAMGVDPNSFLPEPEWEADPQEAWRVERGFTPGGAQMIPRGSAGGGGDGFTMRDYSTARDAVMDDYLVSDGRGGWTAPDWLTPQEIDRAARSLMRGEGYPDGFGPQPEGTPGYNPEGDPSLPPPDASQAGSDTPNLWDRTVDYFKSGNIWLPNAVHERNRERRDERREDRPHPFSSDDASRRSRGSPPSVIGVQPGYQTDEMTGYETLGLGGEAPQGSALQGAAPDASPAIPPDTLRFDRNDARAVWAATTARELAKPTPEHPNGREPAEILREMEFSETEIAMILSIGR